jgi:hypothetical protein
VKDKKEEVLMRKKRFNVSGFYFLFFPNQNDVVLGNSTNRKRNSDH